MPDETPDESVPAKPERVTDEGATRVTNDGSTRVTLDLPPFNPAPDPGPLAESEHLGMLINPDGSIRDPEEVA